MRWRLERGRRLPAYIYDGTAGAYLDEVLKLPAAARPDYFNAGVMLLDLHALRRFELKRRAFEFWTREMQRLLNFDQCVLNHLFAADYKMLDPKWNAMTPVARQRLVREMILWHSRPAALQLAALSRPAIVHFASNKPWNHSNRPRAGLWWANALASPVAGRVVGQFLGKSRLDFRTFYSLALTPLQILRELPTFIRTRSRIKKQEREASLLLSAIRDGGTPRHDGIAEIGAQSEHPMTILHVDTGRTMRGGQWQVLFLMRGLRRHGHKVRLLARGSGLLLRQARAEGFDAGPLNPVSLWRATRTADIVHAHDSRAHTYVAFVRRIPSIVSRRVAFAPRQSAPSRLKYSRADHYIAVSNFVVGQLLSAGVLKERITMIHDGVEVPRDLPTSAREILLAPMTNDPAKGSDILRDAASEFGQPVVFSSNIISELPKAAIFIYISRSEGLGSAAVLASAYGTPVIASNVGGLPEAVLHEKTGLLVDNNKASVVAAVRRLKADPVLRARLAQAGRARATAEFSIDTMVERTIAVYRECLARRRATAQVG
jgi:hypothetical protein